MGNTYKTGPLEIKFYTFLLILYYILNMIYPNVGYGDDQVSERIYPQVTMGLIGIISLVIVFSHINILINSKLCRPYILYLLLGMMYVFITISGTSIETNFIYFLKLDMALFSLGTIYVFLKDKRDLTLKCIYIIYGMQVIYGIEDLIADRFANIQDEEALYFNTNAGFNLIACLPMTLILPKKRLSAYLYIVIMMCCIASGQRSAALSAVITLPFAYKYFKTCITRKDKSMLIVILIIACIPVLYFAITNIMLRNAIDAERGDIGSGRSIFWILLIIEFFNHNLWNIIFGNGYFSPQYFLDQKYGMAIEAHNGWIQNLYVYGFIGLVLYARTIFVMLRYNKLVNKLNICEKNVLLICFIVFFIKCSTSHGNWDITVMPFSLVLAIIADNMKRRKDSIKHLPTKALYSNIHASYNQNKKGFI